MTVQQFLAIAVSLVILIGGGLLLLRLWLYLIDCFFDDLQKCMRGKDADKNSPEWLQRQIERAYGAGRRDEREGR
jgi:hypothetical protein